MNLIKFNKIIFNQLKRSSFKLKETIFKQQLRNLNEFAGESRQIFNFTELPSRKIIKVNGKDAFSYIQLLITNNLQQNLNCINSYITTPNSKILCDLLIYKVKGDVFDKELILNGLTNNNYGKRIIDCLNNLETKDNELIDELNLINNFNVKNDNEEILYLECDINLVDHIKRTLFVRRLGQDVNFEILNEHKVYTIFPTIDHNLNESFIIDTEFISNYFLFVNDPRLPYLGQRLITKLPKNNLDRLLKYKIFRGSILREVKPKDYKLNRYRLGVGEGLNEHLMASTYVNSFNGDYLNGIDLYKGGFLGSQPINRTIQRRNKFLKRLLPFEFINPTNKKLINFPIGTQFYLDNRSIGEFINNIGNYGIGYFDLKPFKYINYSKFIKVKLNYENEKLDAIVKIPFWWTKFKNLQYLLYEDELMKFKEKYFLNKSDDKLLN